MILCSKVSKSYEKNKIIDSFSYSFNDTGFYLLMGESGSGKTTLLNILSGLLSFEGGTIYYDGQNYIKQVSNEQLMYKIDYVTQDSFFVDFLCVMDNLRLVCADENRIIDVLRQFGLKNVSNKMPSVLSGGEKQRLAIVRSLLNSKKILLLDEPTASLDRENKFAVFDLLKKLKDKILIICTTHDKEAKPYADYVIEFPKNRKEES